MFKNLVEKRCSTRKYSQKPVTRETLEKLFETARLAPSAKNLQPLSFSVFTDKDKIARIAETTVQSWIKDSPVLVTISIDHVKAWRRPDGKGHGDIDAAVAVDHLSLAATELGLGTCWICWFDAFKLHGILGLENHQEAVILMAMGYPQNECSERHLRRKPIDELVEYNPEIK